MSWVDAELELRIRDRLLAADLEGAATVAIRGYGPQVLGYLTAVLRDEARADEAFSLFSEDVWKGLPSFRGDSAFATWAYKVAWHAASRVLRDPHRRRRNVPIQSAAMLEARESVRTGTAPHLRTDVKSAIQELRAALSPQEQTLLVLRVDRAMAWDDVAEVLGIAAPLARKRFERVKSKLRRLADARGVGVAQGDA